MSLVSVAVTYLFLPVFWQAKVPQMVLVWKPLQVLAPVFLVPEGLLTPGSLHLLPALYPTVEIAFLVPEGLLTPGSLRLTSALYSLAEVVLLQTVRCLGKRGFLP